ncbi:UPF0187-domain-containing protein [Thelephora ganbajun]|uniref:UPF0187-domain-containing protein n=1 Tax=Thelephora ganbajun TaxID=370292 RepID=A0ACB6ZS70_THEGA|nr:UPF0187-domain-containing protein [Thelephora ganbajun]
MPAVNPLFQGPFSWRKLRATIIKDILPEVIFFTLVATMVSCVDMLTVATLSIPNQLLTVLGTILGLVISFRTTSAYERFSEGRRTWSTFSVLCRHTAQIIWHHVPNERPHKTDPALSKPALYGIVEKKSMINLVSRRMVCSVHMLREEPGVYYEDLYPLVCVLPRYAYLTDGSRPSDLLPMWQASLAGQRSDWKPPALKKSATTLPSTSRFKVGFDPEKVLPTVFSDIPLRPARNPPPGSFFDYFPVLRPLKRIRRLFSRRHETHEEDGVYESDAAERKRMKELPVSNVPLEIITYLNGYNAFLLKNAFLLPPAATSLTNTLASLHDAVSTLDRIRTTPLPFAYQAHLKMSLWLYLFFLPFQIFRAMEWLTIPATTFTSFMLLGFLEIGQEIENPFNYELNDLDLDGFCLALQRDLHEITAHPAPLVPDDYIFTTWNQPFAPADRRPAEEILDDTLHAHHDDSWKESVRQTLLQNWKMVDAETRNH